MVEPLVDEDPIAHNVCSRRWKWIIKERTAPFLRCPVIPYVAKMISRGSHLVPQRDIQSTDAVVGGLVNIIPVILWRPSIIFEMVRVRLPLKSPREHSKLEVLGQHAILDTTL